ncbi:MAG: molybdopterin molybdotransferase MoeA [Acidobacteria bacterium]|nr:molybdopterin molybdotransferase MoeA [Acidobacteriota bacterium]
MPDQGKPETLLACEDALTLVLRLCRELSPQPEEELVGLDDALERVLFINICADRDQPPFHRSTRDGFAVNAAHASTGMPIQVLGQLRAGEVWTGSALNPNEGVEIMTGAPVPAGADAVAMVEHTDRNKSGSIRLMESRSLGSGENIVPQGSEARAGDVVLHAGTRLQAAHVALLASLGCAQVKVSARPRVAIVATGDELVDIQATPGPYQIRNSNSHGIAAIVRACGGEPQIWPPVKDDQNALNEAVAQARQSADLLVLSGGVSAGRYDFVESALAHHGASFFFTGVRMQPGKPVVFGQLPALNGHRPLYVFGLPGNPVSTQVTSLLFVAPLLRALAGDDDPAPRFASATLAHEVKTRSGLTRFLPAIYAATLTGTKVSLTGWQGSGDLSANARANCYAVIPANAEKLNLGTQIQLLLR